MMMGFFAHIIANIPEGLIWLVLVIGWIIIQAIAKSSKKPGSGGGPPPDHEPTTELDEFLEQLAGRARKPDKPEPGAPAPRVVPHVPDRPKPAPAPGIKHPPRKAAARPAHPPLYGRHKQPRDFQKIDAVRHNLGTPVQDIEHVLKSRKTARKIAWLKALNTPEDWRRAILLREIMGPPKALRTLDSAIPGRGE